ncbi:Fumarate reductase flavoprotein subunit [Dickeya solani]|nr:Fumarate reductase flavoprotein subunit [Dickeya solani]
MQTFNADLAIIGAGGAGLRAAIAAAEANPQLKIALISKVYPMRSHTVAAEGDRRRSHKITIASTSTSTTPWLGATGCVNRTWWITSCSSARAK